MAENEQAAADPLAEAWRAVWTQRHDTPSGPDSFYAGIVRAANTIRAIQTSGEVAAGAAAEQVESWADVAAQDQCTICGCSRADADEYACAVVYGVVVDHTFTDPA